MNGLCSSSWLSAGEKGLPVLGSQLKVKGSVESLSGLVQLPPNEGKEPDESSDEFDESEMHVQAEPGRLISAPAFALASQKLTGCSRSLTS